jgi:pyruvate dehydrogenase E1 component beta subunit
MARKVREGTDVTVVGISTGVHAARQAAEKVADEGISVEIIDPRTMVPLDSETILSSVARTGRLVIVDPAHMTCGAAAEISAIVAEKAFDSLKAPVMRVTTPDTQIPFSPALEKQLYPDAARTVAAIHKVMSSKSRATV